MSSDITTMEAPTVTASTIVCFTLISDQRRSFCAICRDRGGDDQQDDIQTFIHGLHLSGATKAVYSFCFQCFSRWFCPSPLQILSRICRRYIQPPLNTYPRFTPILTRTPAGDTSAPPAAII